MSKQPSRRQALLVFGASALGLAFTNACKKPSNSNFSCVDVTGLAPDDVSARATVGYVDRAIETEKSCLTCQQFVVAASDLECGTCKVMKGPVHPLGSCKVFAKKS